MFNETAAIGNTGKVARKRSLLWALRVAFSVAAFAVVAVLILLWVRSYTYAEGLTVPGTPMRITHFKGEVGLHWRLGSLFERTRVSGIPYLLPVLAAGMLPFVPWIKWSRRFNIRAMLIVAAIAALALGALATSVTVQRF